MFHYTQITKPSHPDPENLQEFKALHSARNREEELKMEKRQICHEMQEGMGQVEDGVFHVQLRPAMLADVHST